MMKLQLVKGEMAKHIWKGYGEGFLVSVLLTFFMWIAAYQMSWLFPSYINALKFWSPICATIAVATTLYGRPGWEIQTWDGESELERLDNSIFKALSIVSYSLTIFTVFLSSQ